MLGKKIEVEALEPLILALSLKDRSFLLKIQKYLDTSKEAGKSYFNDEKNQTIFNYIVRYFTMYKKIPKKETLKAVIDKGKHDSEIKFLIHSIIDKIYEMENLDAEYIQDEVVNFIKKVKLYEAIIESEPDIEEDNYDTILTRVEDAVRINFDKDLGISVRNTTEAFDRINRLDKEVKISTGFPVFNNIIDGGFHPKEIYCFAAIPGGFKTGFIGNLAINNLLDGKKVLVYTFETSSERLLMRYYANIAGMSKTEIIQHEDEAKNKVAQKTSLTEGELIIKEYNANEISSNDLMAHIDDLQMHQGFTPDIVYVDYILIMKTNDRSLHSEDSYKYYKTVTEELRNIGKSLYIPVVTACQINREGMSDRGGSKALTTSKMVSESRGILDTVDMFATINQTASDKQKGNYYLYFDKNRNERTGIKIQYEVNYEHMKLEEKGLVT